VKPYRSAIAIVFTTNRLPFSSRTYTQTTPPYKNPALPIQQRVDDLVSRMTLEEKASQMMNGAAAIPRLDIPDYEWWNEGLHGVARAGYATVFPQAIGLAATWNTDLMNRLADVISTEARAKYNDFQSQGRSRSATKGILLESQHQHFS
jgi:beta-glucosidase